MTHSRPLTYARFKANRIGKIGSILRRCRRVLRRSSQRHKPSHDKPENVSVTTISGSCQFTTSEPACCMAKTSSADALMSSTLPMKSIFAKVSRHFKCCRCLSGHQTSRNPMATTPKGALGDSLVLCCGSSDSADSLDDENTSPVPPRRDHATK